MTGQSRLQSIQRNAVSLLAGDVLNKAGTFAMYAMLARFTGKHEFGQLSLGLMLLYAFHIFAAAGLPTLITREVAKRPEWARSFLYHGYLAALVPAAGSMLIMALFPWFMGYEPGTRRVICLLAVAIVPYALSAITEGVIRGREKMHLIAIANVPGNVGMLAAGYYVLSAGYGVVALAGVMAAARLGTLLFAHLLGQRVMDRAQAPMTLSVGYSWKLLRQSFVFLISDSIIIISSSLNALILSKFTNVSELALLSASHQILQPVLMVYRSVGNSTLPTLSAAGRHGAELIASLSSELIVLLSRLGIPAAVILFVFAADILGVVYGNPEFRSGAFVLQILVVGLVINLVNPVLGQGLLAVGQEKKVLRIVVVDLAVTLTVGLLLIKQYGLLGAAVAALVVNAVSVAQHGWYFRREIGELTLAAELLRLVPATVWLLLASAWLPLPRILSIAIGLVVYLKLAGFKRPVKMGAWLGVQPAIERPKASRGPTI